ncbi:MAG: 50S ribosomal protein L23 [Succinatimonas sp.]|uniref:50S ribosomal protein L23 n=1 Tax=Succinivibrio sp. TaxID=2053619 RepID=UPI000D78CC71|nr:50S ribosomal protein L23 [Succinivibrio sp.]MCI6345887.1 50S ribosomal protein L23 [Succinatimonas sp.]HJI58596.1 50S ribosomal protein L23 [Succinivibrionaceae bacterium]MBQ8022789.1 50S ribosomal protein L23 [Succinivibrio sp.]MDD6376667.1 50S ribosomal protein L23 [Succinatimonas sp.]
MMSEARLMNILRAPVISEKSSAAQQDKNTLVFKVLKDATKDEIKAAVETLFNVKVEAVRTLNFQGKVRRTARGFGKRSDWKKAYVTLPEGTQLDIEDASQQTNKESK